MDRVTPDRGVLMRPRRSTRRRARARRRVVGRAGRYLASLVVAVALLGPVLWMVLTTFEPEGQIAAHTLAIDVGSFSLDNYTQALGGIPGFGRVDVIGGLERSFLSAAISSLISLNVAAAAAYVLARFTFRGRHVVGIAVLATQVVPIILLVVPLFTALQAVGLTNTVPGLLIVYTAVTLPFSYTAVTLPFSIVLLRGYFATLPAEIEQAAMIDGCGYLGILYRIVYPLALPAFIAVFIFDFLSIWNEFLLALILSNNAPTLTVALYGFTTQGTIYWGPLLAAATLATLPALLIFLPLQRYLVQGLTAGAVK